MADAGNEAGRTAEGALEGRCGSCARFVHATDRAGADGKVERVGDCLLGVWPSPLSERGTCTHYAKRGEFKPSTGKRPQATSPKKAGPPVRPPQQPLTIPEDLLNMDADEFRLVLRHVLRDELGLGNAHIGPRWEGGEVILKPGREGVAEKRIPIENLFRKVVLIRDKLRVLEQKINSHPHLTDEEKVQMQQYVTQCYGSLTTFNVLFTSKDDGFVGQRGGED
jgi:hypothetical protein